MRKCPVRVVKAVSHLCTSYRIQRSQEEVQKLNFNNLAEASGMLASASRHRKSCKLQGSVDGRGKGVVKAVSDLLNCPERAVRKLS